jgi:hypothetical protein
MNGWVGLHEILFGIRKEDEFIMGGAGLMGKSALVSGAARRIGRQIALALADAGVNVVIHYNHSA